MAGKSLNARPVGAFNQRPTAAPTKSLSPRNPYGGNQDQSRYMQAVRAEPTPSERSIDKRSFDVNAAGASNSNASSNSTNVAQAISNRAASSSNRAPVSNTSDNPNDLPTDPMSAAVLISAFRSVVSPFAVLNDKVIQKNYDLASGIGMSNDDRTVSFEVASYLMMNMGYMFMGLVLDDSFKDAFSSAVLVEINLDEKTPEEIKKARAEMQAEQPATSDGSIVLGVTSFIPRVSEFFMTKLHESFDALSSYGDEFGDAVKNLSYDYKLELGFIFSNFMYLIRAFTHNRIFLGYVTTVVEKVKELMTN